MKRAAGDADLIRIVALNVHALRKAAGLSQEELAHQADIDRTYISQVERRQRNLTISVLGRIARALGTTPDRLLVSSALSADKLPRRRRRP
jgi:transcriptional regulator with XRE-family HTH domain